MGDWLDDLDARDGVRAANPAPPDKVAPGGLRGVITGERGPTTGTGEAAARGGLQGATLGFGDEAAAAIDTVVSHVPGLRSAANALNDGPLPIDNPNLTYQQRRDAYRARNTTAQAEHPIVYTGAELGGAMLAPVPGAAGKGLVKAVKAGAKAGAAAGLGGSDADLTHGDVVGTLRDTALGTGLGAGGALLAHGAAAGARKLFEGAKTRVLERTSEDVLRGENAAGKKTANKAIERFGEDNQRLGDLLAREPKLEKTLALAAESSPAKAAKAVEEVSTRLNSELDGIYGQMAKGKRLVNPAQIRAEFDRMVGEATKAGDETVTAAMERARDQFTHRFPDGYGPIAPETLRGYKSSAARAAFSQDTTAPASAKAKVQQMVWRTFGDAIEKQAKGSGVDVARLRQLNQDVSVLIPLEHALGERVAAGQRGSISLKEMLTGAGGGAGAGFIHGALAGGGAGEQALILGLAGAGVAKFGPKVGKAAVRRLDYAASKATPAMVDQYAARVSAFMGKGLTLSQAVEAAKAEEARPAAHGKRPAATSFEAKSPGMVEPGNIDIMNRPDVANADGSHSSVRSMSFSEGGPEILVPTVSEDGRIMTEDEAIAQYRKTGRHLGKFKTPDDATAYSQRLHEQQAGMMGL